MSNKMTVQETKGPPPAPSKEELLLSLQRYKRRIPAQEMRLAQANMALEEAETAVAAARKEVEEAQAARDVLKNYITDLSEQIGA